MQPEAIIFPCQYFNPIALTVTEDKEGFVKRIELKGVFDDGAESINGLSHIGITAG